MGQVANVIVTASKLTRYYAENLLKDVRADQFARLATVGGKQVQSNHPAFVYGHLSLYNPRVIGMLGAGATANPPGFEELFANGKQCVDDPTGKTYPTMDAIRTHFFTGFDAAVAAVGKASDADLSKPNPNEGRMREMFPTIGDLAGFFLSGHAMSHLGQVTAWRRMMGLGSAM